MKGQAEQAPLASRQYFASNIKEDGRRGGAGLKHPDTPLLLENEEPAATIVGVSHIERTQQSGRHHRFERNTKRHRAGILTERGGALRSRGGFLPPGYHGTT